MLLAIDTSGDFAGVALWQAGSILAAATWRTGRRHTEQLLPQLDLLLKHTASTPADLSCVAVAIGPGSWTGLRVGLSLAKAIAQANDVPIIGVPTHEMWAWSHRELDQLLVVVIRLGRGRYAIARFDPLAQPCAGPIEPQVYELAAVPIEPAVYVGEIDPPLAERIGSVGKLLSGLDTLRLR
ncbi:MAG: hypothetical protein NVS4B8_29570 [Herpetosiphon sp.]